MISEYRKRSNRFYIPVNLDIDYSVNTRTIEIFQLINLSPVPGLLFMIGFLIRRRRIRV